MAREYTIYGMVQPGFEPVERAFRDNFLKRGEIGASVCAYVDGRNVVDLWGGFANKETDVLWEADTMITVFSATKGMLQDQGLLDLDKPIAYYWPGFAKQGKAPITVRQLLNHRSGLCAIEKPLSLADLWDEEKVTDALEAQTPYWQPGTAQGYHAVSFGLYVSELFKRVAGMSVGRFLSDYIATPLKADVYLGLPFDLQSRIATLYPVTTKERLLTLGPRTLVSREVEGRMLRKLLQPSSETSKSIANPKELGAQGLHNFNRYDVQVMELPWVNAQASARGLAKVYAALAHGGSWEGTTLCQPGSLRPLEWRQSWSWDRVLQKWMGFSQGFVKEEPIYYSPNSEAYGHPGAGGCVGLADPTKRLSLGYVMNRMDPHLRSPRSLALCHALYRCL
jgi:CubicO group peptidase (beta-lactamase class C family)